jgi:RNA polymerase sigma-70 factor, ECF subfamily
MTIPDSPPTGPVSDAALMARVQDQDSAAFALLYERYSGAILRRLENILRSEAAAQDLLQEVFLRVWLRAEQWTGQGSLKGWLYRIVTNLAFNHLRTLRRHPEQPLVMPDESAWDEWAEEEEPAVPGWLVDQSAAGPVGELERSERSAHLRGLIEALPEEKREVFRLVQEMELTIRDAAGRLGIPEGTVKSRLHYAQKKLSQEWQKWEP